MGENRARITQLFSLKIWKSKGSSDRLISTLIENTLVLGKLFYISLKSDSWNNYLQFGINFYAHINVYFLNAQGIDNSIKRKNRNRRLKQNRLKIQDRHLTKHLTSLDSLRLCCTTGTSHYLKAKCWKSLKEQNLRSSVIVLDLEEHEQN